MKNWLFLNQRDLDKHEEKDIAGVHVQVSFSPYEIPSAVRGYHDPINEWFVIEFKYLIENEPTSEKFINDVSTVLVGRNSGRLYTIRINTKKLKVEAIGLELKALEKAKETIDNISSLERNFVSRQLLTKQAINTKEQELLESMRSTDRNNYVR